MLFERGGHLLTLLGKFGWNPRDRSFIEQHECGYYRWCAFLCTRRTITFAGSRRILAGRGLTTSPTLARFR